MSKKPFKSVKSILSRFKADKKGNVGIIFGIVLVPIMIAMGSAVDYSQAFTKQKNLSTAVDAAVLAGGVFSQSSQNVFEDKVRQTLYSNFPEADVASLTFDLDAATSVVQVTATSNVPTAFAGIWGVSSIPIQATASAAPNRQWAEIALVLDNTGSMGSSGKMDALKSAAKRLVNTLHDTADDPSKLFIGVVPFSGTIRLGPDLLNSSFIDSNGQSGISGEDFIPGTTNVLDLYSAMDEFSWNGCVRARAGGYDLLDTEANAGNPDTLFLPYFAPDEPDDNDDNEDNGTGYWFYNRYIDDNKPNPGGSMEQRQRDTVKYTTVTPNSGNVGIGPEFNCPPQPILDLTTTRQDVLDAIDGMVPQGSTVIPTGLAWGWRLVTPAAPYQARPFDNENKKFIILLTDGQNYIGGGYLYPNYSFYNAYGYAAEGHLGSTNGSQAEATLDAKTAALCTNAKAQGIRIFTITFQLNNGAVKDLFRDCATTPTMYYDSPDNSSLDETFEKIASELQKLRLTK